MARVIKTISFSESKLVVLSGQHSCKSLLTLREEHLTEYGEESLPPCLRTIRADVLKFSTPLEQRVLIAGNEQFRQEGTTRIPISWWCHHFLQSMIPEDRSLIDGITLAVQKCGYKRLPTKVL